MQTEVAHETVPELLRGAWRRAWIRYADGSSDDTTTVVWIQLADRMADIRVPAGHAALADRGSLRSCDAADLIRLADSESSTGFTVCSPISTGNDGVRRATADWVDTDVAFQPVSAFPEPGDLEWNVDGEVMIERAPSGAYVERWERIPGSAGPLSHHEHGAVQWFVAGDVAISVRDRPVPVRREARLDELIADAASNRSAIEALVDCEFSLVERIDDAWVVTVSTHPWRVGEVVDVSAR